MSGQELPVGWSVSRIGDLCELINGKAFKPSDWGAEGLPIIRIQNLNSASAKFNYFAGNVSEKFIVKPGELLFAWSGTPGTSFGAHIWRGQRGVLNQHIFRVLFDKRAANKDFFRLAINQKLIELIGKAQGGVGLRHVTKGTFEDTEIAYPPLPEQSRIVEKVEALTTRSRSAREALDALPSLIDSYRSAILAREIEAAAEGADNVPLGNLLSALTSGSRDWAKYYDCGNGVFVLAGNVRPMAFDPVPRRFVDPPRDSADARRSRIEKADLLLTIVGAGTGDVCRVSSGYDDYFVCQSVALLRLKQPELSRWVELFLNCQAYGKGQIDRLIYGQGRPHLSFEDIRRIQIKVPKLDAIRSAVNRMEAGLASLDRMHSAYAEALLKLATLDQSILAKAFRGELVPQDPNDEPASVLLERIRAERAAAGPAPRRGRRPKATGGG